MAQILEAEEDRSSPEPAVSRRRIGEILEAVETRQLEGTLRDREEALEWLKKEFLATDKHE